MNTEKEFGYELILDLKNCDKKLIGSAISLEKYVIELCNIIDMKRYGNVMLHYFGLNDIHTKGFSLVQLIETSSIVGHFAEETGKVYINIFSCKDFSIIKAKDFTETFFKGKIAKYHFLVRE